MHDPSFGIRIVRSKRDVDYVRIRRSKPLVCSGLRLRLRARLGLRISPGSVAVWPGRGDLGGHCNPAMVVEESRK